MHNLSQDERSKIYAVYVAIYNLPFTLQRKTTLLTALMGGAKWSWRVVGITPAALQLLAANNYRYAKGKVCRAHMVDRIDTARKMFEDARPLSEDQFFSMFWKNDKTIIATKSENKNGGPLPTALPIDYRRGLFQSGLVGWRHGTREADYLRQLHAKYKLRKN
jgi:hypothetical protein